jgi:hypothetical protein
MEREHQFHACGILPLNDSFFQDFTRDDKRPQAETGYLPNSDAENSVALS